MPRPSTSQESREIVLQFVNNFIERLDTEDFILPKKDRCSPFEFFLKLFPEEVKPQDGGTRPTGVSQAGFNKILINDLSFVDGMRNPLRNTVQAHTGMSSSRHFLCCRWRHPEKAESFLGKLSATKAEIMRKLLWEAFEWTQTIGVAGRGGDRSIKIDIRVSRCAEGEQDLSRRCNATNIDCHPMCCAPDAPIMLDQRAVSENYFAGQFSSLIRPAPRVGIASLESELSALKQPQCVPSNFHSAAGVGQSTLMDLLASAASYTPARDFLNQFHSVLAAAPPNSDTGAGVKVPQLPTSPSSAASTSDVWAFSGRGGLPAMSLPFPLSTAVPPPTAESGNNSSLGKRYNAPSCPFNYAVGGSNGAAEACERVPARSSGHSIAPKKRARLEEAEAAARAGTATAMPPPLLLPPLRLPPCDEPGASVVSGGQPSLPPPLGGQPAATEPLMPISIALWPHSGPAAAGPLRLPPLPRMDWLAPAGALPRPAAAAAGSS